MLFCIRKWFDLCVCVCVWLKESEEGADAAESREEADEGEEPSDEDGLFSALGFLALCTFYFNNTWHLHSWSECDCFSAATELGVLYSIRSQPWLYFDEKHDLEFVVIAITHTVSLFEFNTFFASCFVRKFFSGLILCRTRKKWIQQRLVGWYFRSAV